EPQCGHVVFDASRTELELPEQVGLVAAQIIRTELVRRLAEVLCEPFDETQITPRRAGRVVATLELFEHHFAKTSHSVLPPVTHTLSRPQNYSSANTAATAAPAASFLPANRKLRKTSDRIACIFRIRLLDPNWTHLQDRSETCR